AQPRPGTVDTSFDPQTPLTLTRAIAVDSQARVLSVGNLSSGGATLVRLSNEGKVDGDFSVAPAFYGFADLSVLELQGNQKIVFAGTLSASRTRHLQILHG